MMALSGMRSQVQDQMLWQAVMSHIQSAVLMFTGKFLRSWAVWLGLRDETPNKYLQQ